MCNENCLNTITFHHPHVLLSVELNNTCDQRSGGSKISLYSAGLIQDVTSFKSTTNIVFGRVLKKTGGYQSVANTGNVEGFFSSITNLFRKAIQILMHSAWDIPYPTYQQLKLLPSKYSPWPTDLSILCKLSASNTEYCGEP